MMNHEFCQIVGMVAAYLDRHPDGADRLRAFLNDDKLLLDTEDLMRLTGWKRTHISHLCATGLIPHIPGRPNKFILAAVKKALEQMQQGAGNAKTTRRGGKP